MFAAPGSRTTGRAARNVLVISRQWQGQAAAGLDIIRSPTLIVGIAGHTQTNGVADYENVHKIQQGYTLTPLRPGVKACMSRPQARSTLAST